MDKKQANEFIGTIICCQIGASFRSQGYVPRAQVFIMGAHDSPNGEWRLMALAKIGLDTWLIQDISPSNHGWIGETIFRVDEDSLIGKLDFLYCLNYGEPFSVVNSKKVTILHPELVRKGINSLFVHRWEYRVKTDPVTRMVKAGRRWLKDRSRPAYIQG